MTDFKGLLLALGTGAVEFIVVGGMAAVAHGIARVTFDLDVVYRRTPENIARLAQVIAPLKPRLRGAPPDLPFRWDERTIRAGLNFTLATKLGELDVLGEITGGGDYEKLLPHSESFNLFGVRCQCLDLETLIKVKAAVGRPKDLEPLAELRALME